MNEIPKNLFIENVTLLSYSTSVLTNSEIESVFFPHDSLTRNSHEFHLLDLSFFTHESK